MPLSSRPCLLVAIQRDFFCLERVIFAAHVIYTCAVAQFQSQFLDGVPGVKMKRKILVGYLPAFCHAGYKTVRLRQR